MSGYHERADGPHNSEEDDDVAIDAVEEEGLVADEGGKLEAGEQRGGQDGDKVHYDAGFLVIESKVSIALAGGGVEGSVVGAAELAVEVGHWQPGEHKANHGTSKNNP